jgi:hypothetical protein
MEAEMYNSHMYCGLEGSKGERRMRGYAEHTLLPNIASRNFGFK